MIGVVSKKKERDIVREFFQLFKTPWEFFKEGKTYSVIICTTGDVPDIETSLLIVYSARQVGFDSTCGVNIGSDEKHKIIEYRSWNLPVYGRLLLFEPMGRPVLTVKGTHELAGIELQIGKNRILRIGYDLFEEVNYLFSSGQPPEFASIPTMEVHLSMLRDGILSAGIPLVEIPPVPMGYDYTVCLTHDVDFVGIRNHLFDHTMFGFLYRAVMTSFFDFLKGRLAFRKLLKNWGAALLLPAVYTKMAKDFWIQFEQYMKIENGLPSTFFFIPFKGRAGKSKSGSVPLKRGCKYDICDAKSYVRQLVSWGCEIGVHGIDAWLDPESGGKELNRIKRVAGNTETGVRMHWLYLMEDSLKHLDEAGFFYDSTLGYNDAIGYRSGTTQVFRPLDVKRLFELPLHVQDTALFYPSRMHLKEVEAFDLICKLIGNAKKFGGVVTINWHHRSLGPERCWGDFYMRLLEYLKRDRAWFVCARDAVKWFQKRRMISFEDVSFEERRVKIKTKGCSERDPGLAVRIFSPNTQLCEVPIKDNQTNYVDYPLIQEMSVINRPQGNQVTHFSPPK